MGRIGQGLMIALNDLRDHSSQEYQNYITELNPESSIDQLSAPLLAYPAIYNEFCSALVQRIVYTQVLSQVYQNPLKELEGDDMPLGYLGQEIFINPAISRDYDIDDFAGVLKKYEADVKVQYQNINFDKQYVVTIIREKLKQAFVSWDELERFISGITNSLYNGLYIDEYNNTKALVTQAYNSNAVQMQVISAPTTEELAKSFMEKARETYFNFQAPSTEFNAWSKVGGYGRAVETFTNPEDIVILIRNDVQAKLDVQVLASAFNISKTDLIGKIYPVNNFDYYDRKTGEKILDGSKIVALICDKRWFRIKNEDIYMEDFRNANNRSLNYYLNAIKMYKYSYFANALCFVTELPTVAITGLKFAESTKAVKVGATESVGVIPTPLNATSPTITYTSSNDSVATVEADSDDNKVVKITGVSAGSVTITATAGNVSTTMAVTVENVNIESMHFENTAYEAEVGTDATAKLVVNPTNANAPTVVYTSSNSSVFTVDANDTDPHTADITPVGAGTAILTATAGEGANAIVTTATVVVTSA